MPFVPYNLDVFLAATETARVHETVMAKAALFSCPDLIVPVDVLRKKLPANRVKTALTLRSDSEDILRWHVPARSAAGVSEIYDTHRYLFGLGIAATSFDIVASRGCEVVHDLCMPLPPEHVGDYDILFDCILNQCFDPAAVMRNGWDTLRIGGVAVHCVPASITNQGFYCVSPNFFPDFYRVNGGRIIEQHVVIGVYVERERMAAAHLFRTRNAPDAAMNLVVAIKERQVPYTRPIMTKFLDHPTVKVPSHAVSA